jgi:membrane protease subunit (stomatin/prohibitin family)
MDDASMGVGLLLFPQMFRQLTQNDKERDPSGQRIMAICPHCGTINEHPYKFCRECGKRPELPRCTDDEEKFVVCPYCGKDLDLPKQPRFCPYCAERFE